MLKATQQLRAISFGQDRYRRRYWLIPHAGGIFVEGMESAELPEDCSHVEVQGHANENEHVAQTTGKDSICFEDTKLKKTEKIENTDTVVLCKNEQQDVPQSAEFSVETKLKKDDIPFTSSNLKIVHEQSCDKKDSVILDKSEKEKMESLPTTTVVNVFQSPKVLDTQSRTPKFAPISECVGDVRINNHEMQSTPMFGSDSVLSETSLVFPKEINGILANHHHHHQIKEEGGNAGQNGNFCESFLSAVPQYHISAEQILKSFAERQNHKPWFSILPRMPCDETSLTRIHPTVGGNCTNATATLFNSHPNRTSPVVSLTQSNKFSSLSTSSSSSQKYSPLPFGPLGFHNNAAFVAFQVGMIKKLSHGCGSPLLVPPDLNLGTTNNYSDPYFAARNGFVPLAGSPVTSYLRPGVSTRSASPYSDVTAIDNLTQQQQQQQQRKVQPIPKGLK